ncbi:MAG: hypothetical protein QXI16_04820, partial [Sulfolobaceae archaeon]
MSLSSYVVNYPEFQNMLTQIIQQQLGITTDPTQLQFLSLYTNMLASLAENELFYISMLSNESFMSQAITPSAILAHANSMGYKIQNATPASGYITLYIPIDRLTIPQFQVSLSNPTFQTTTNVIYTCPYEVTINYNGLQNIANLTMQSTTNTFSNNAIITQFVDPNNNVRTALMFNLPIVQAVIATITYVLTTTDVTAGSMPTININLSNYFSTNVLQSGQLGNISVYNNNIQYTQASSLFTMAPGSQTFLVTQGTNSVSIILGNGTFGSVQQPGSTFTINIPITLGSQGNILENTLTPVNSFVDNFTGSTLQVFTTNAAISNGLDGDTIAQIRTNAINSLTANNRLVTATDYSILSNNSNTIIDNLAIVKRSDLLANTVSLFLVPQITLPTGQTRPLKACSGTFSINMNQIITTPQIVIKQGEAITLYIFDYPTDPTLTSTTAIKQFGQWQNYALWTMFTTWYTSVLQGQYYEYEGISPFEIQLFVNPLQTKTYYLLSNSSIALTPITSTVLPSDQISTGYVNNLSINWNYNTQVYDVNLVVSLNSPIFSSFSCPASGTSLSVAASGLVNNSNLVQLTITDLVTNNQQIFTNFTVNACSITNNVLQLTLYTSIHTSSITTDPYSIDIQINYPYQTSTFTVYETINPNISFKTDLTNYLSGGVSLQSNYFNLFNIWAIQENDWFNYQQLIESTILSNIQQLVQSLESQRMLTTKIELSLA